VISFARLRAVAFFVDFRHIDESLVVLRAEATSRCIVLVILVLLIGKGLLGISGVVRKWFESHSN